MRVPEVGGGGEKVDRRSLKGEIRAGGKRGGRGLLMEKKRKKKVRVCGAGCTLHINLHQDLGERVGVARTRGEN